MTVPEVVADPQLVALALHMMEDEKESCELCADGWLPPHFRSFVSHGLIVNRPCESNSRVFDPQVPGFVGNSHCTCDTCF